MAEVYSLAILLISGISFAQSAQSRHALVILDHQDSKSLLRLRSHTNKDRLSDDENENLYNTRYHSFQPARSIVRLQFTIERSRQVVGLF